RKQLARFADDVALQPAPMSAAHAGNDAKTAGMIAPFRNFEVGKMLRREPKTGRREIGDIIGANVDVQEGRRNRLGLNIAPRPELPPHPGPLPRWGRGRLGSLVQGLFTVPVDAIAAMLERLMNYVAHARDLIDAHERI